MDLDELYRLLRGSHVRAQGVVDTIRDPLLVLGPDLTVISANPAFYRTFKTDREATIDMPFDKLGEGQWNIDELRLLLEQVIPRSASVFDYEVTAEFPHVGLRTMLVSAQRLAHPDNGQRVLLVTIADATERRRVEVEKDILIGELDHRIKNLLSVTHALARQTDVAGRSADEYRDTFLGRFEALGRSMEATANGRTAELPALARAVVEPYMEGDRDISVADEAKVDLASNKATPLGMILHELATNATKFGALSVPAGRVKIHWKLSTDEDDVSWVHLNWVETDGPETVSPEATGFGTRLIRFTAERELGGRAELSYRREGLIATVSFPR
ncbi:Two-component sensor histidine kinase, contains HisKA and HATPase domains [Palleronia marisminoris]|uniref:histidine kinase n=1 Tax=Palleronia marisminoris TaxID=315423 RepID=A0A1Y5S5Z3_9RHOB|nr:PAS domain-containing sensor histidine kinase [Palleronia marisminoris]SFG64283.1 Two-component sensor histidine kinase, contains HisKA and HATPase domains [Palleronia marisminoris]SLN33321.1 Blue-light-activated histidine kinase [Palleronia marisminoris]